MRNCTFRFSSATVQPSCNKLPTRAISFSGIRIIFPGLFSNPNTWILYKKTYVTAKNPQLTFPKRVVFVSGPKNGETLRIFAGRNQRSNQNSDLTPPWVSARTLILVHSSSPRRRSSQWAPKGTDSQSFNQFSRSTHETRLHPKNIRPFFMDSWCR